MNPATSQTVSTGPVPNDPTPSALESGFKIFSSYLGGVVKEKEKAHAENVDFLKLALSTGQGYVDSSGKVQTLPYEKSKGYYESLANFAKAQNADVERNKIIAQTDASRASARLDNAEAAQFETLGITGTAKAANPTNVYEASNVLLEFLKSKNAKREMLDDTDRKRMLEYLRTYGHGKDPEAALAEIEGQL